MKVMIEVEIQEADIIFKALNFIDPSNILLKSLKDKVAIAAQAAIKENEKNEKN